MSRKFCVSVIASAIAVATGIQASYGQNVGETVGKSIDQGLSELGNEIHQGWDEIRHAADRMGVQARVYARLHWDKALQGATINIDVPKVGTILLRGSVPNASARAKAVQLTNDTIGVEQVIDRLAVELPASKAESSKQAARAIDNPRP